jgi:hypothetical protein
VAPVPNSTSCTDCLPGYYQAKIGQGACLNCEPGRYIVEAASDTCNDCPNGKSSSNPVAEAEAEAEAETEAEAPRTRCFGCEAGKAQRLQGQPSCEACASGFYTAASGATTCLACKPGRYSVAPSADVGAVTCVDCAAGRNQPLTGQADCAPCAVATFADTPGTASCEPCAGDRFSFEGSPYCDRCLRRFYAHIPGDELLDEHASCVHCPLGTTCDGDGQSTTRVLELDPGFWRITPTEGQVYACPNGAVACRGGTNFSAGGLSYCNLGFEGVLCDICSDNYYFDTEDMTCILCDAASKSVAGIFQAPIVIFFLSLLSLLILYLLLKKFREAMQKKIMGKEEWEEMELEKRKQQQEKMIAVKEKLNDTRFWWNRKVKPKLKGKLRMNRGVCFARITRSRSTTHFPCVNKLLHESIFCYSGDEFSSDRRKHVRKFHRRIPTKL